MATRQERRRIIDLTARDHFVRWADDLFYLERGSCPYLKDGLCSVQEIKPFVCQIFPFAPRVVEGELWLYCVGECLAATNLPPGFTEKAVTLARAFFQNRPFAEYADYWNKNKIGDFDDDQLVFRVKVFEEATVQDINHDRTPSDHHCSNGPSALI